MSPPTLKEKFNRLSEQRRHQQLQGVCDLLIENDIPFDELEEYFLHLYKPKSLRAAEVRGRRRSKVNRVEIARNANNIRWNRYNALKTSHIERKEEQQQRIKDVEKPKGLSLPKSSTKKSSTKKGDDS